MVRKSLSRDETVEIRHSWNDRTDLKKVGAEYVRKGPATAKPQDESKPALQRGLTAVRRDEIRVASRTGLWRALQTRLSKDFAF